MTDRLDEIRARLDGATPGPWRLEKVGDYGNDVWAIADAYRWRGLTNHINVGEDKATGEFIAAAPADISFLLGEVERLTAERASIPEQIAATIVRGGQISDGITYAPYLACAGIARSFIPQTGDQA